MVEQSTYTDRARWSNEEALRWQVDLFLRFRHSR